VTCRLVEPLPGADLPIWPDRKCVGSLANADRGKIHVLEDTPPFKNLRPGLRGIIPSVSCISPVKVWGPFALFAAMDAKQQDGYSGD
jgi:hypothetical protein